MDGLFFTSDTHFSHAKVIEYSKRPFDSVEAMNEALIKNWNDRISKNDTVYHLGDFSFDSAGQTGKIFDRLNGHKHLVRGNHDKNKVLKNCNWASVEYYKEIKVDDKDALDGRVQRIVMLHYKMEVWNKSHFGAFHLFGHSHGSMPDDPFSLSTDVGVDTHSYKPWSYAEIKAVMKTKTFKPVDRHGTENRDREQR